MPRKTKPTGFIGLIETQRGGELLQELDEAVEKLVTLCGARPGKKGRIVLTLEITQDARHETVFKVADKDVKVIEPPRPREPEIRFRNNQGSLVEDRQEQQKIFPDPES